MTYPDHINFRRFSISFNCLCVCVCVCVCVCAVRLNRLTMCLHVVKSDIMLSYEYNMVEGISQQQAHCYSLRPSSSHKHRYYCLTPLIIMQLDSHQDKQIMTLFPPSGVYSHCSCRTYGIRTYHIQLSSLEDVFQ